MANSPTLEKLFKLTDGSKAAEIGPILMELATSPSDDCIEYARNSSDLRSDAVARNVAIAGLTGLVIGSFHLDCTDGSGKRAYCVNPFLHQLRFAMLNCSALRARMEDNAKRYLFYPEFPGNTSERIVKIAIAHAGMNSKNEEFIPLYSLGGLFDAKTVKNGLPKPNATGTTCIMTARAIYHAAGADMIAQKMPRINTPNGPNIDLLMGFTKDRSVLGDARFQAMMKTAKTMKDVAGAEKAATEEFDAANQASPPNLGVADIYMINGPGEARYLLRPGSKDQAGHVGIVVAKAGDAFTTVDGGSGSGEAIDIRSRKLKYFSGLGWSFGDSYAYTEQMLAAVKIEIDKYVGNDSLVEQWINTQPQGAIQRENLRKAKERKGKAGVTASIEKTNADAAYRAVIDAGLRLIKIGEGGKVHGKVRTVQGWWKPSSYSALTEVDRNVVLGALRPTSLLPVGMTGYKLMEAMPY